MQRGEGGCEDARESGEDLEEGGEGTCEGRDESEKISASFLFNLTDEPVRMSGTRRAINRVYKRFTKRSRATQEGGTLTPDFVQAALFASCVPSIPYSPVNADKLMPRLEARLEAESDGEQDIADTLVKTIAPVPINTSVIEWSPFDDTLLTVSVYFNGKFKMLYMNMPEDDDVKHLVTTWSGRFYRILPVGDSYELKEVIAVLADKLILGFGGVFDKAAVPILDVAYVITKTGEHPKGEDGKPIPIEL